MRKSEAESDRQYDAEAFSLNTRRTYNSNWKVYEDFCDESGYNQLAGQPYIINEYLEFLYNSDKELNTILGHLTAIRHFFSLVDLPDPTARFSSTEIIAALKKIIPPSELKIALTIAELELTCGNIDTTTTQGVRDHALLCCGYAGAYRPSELLDIDVHHISFDAVGLTVNTKKSKADQHRKGYTKLITYEQNPDICPVRAMQKWLLVSGVTSGPVFRPLTQTGAIINRRLAKSTLYNIIQARTTAAGLQGKDYSGQSLRRSFVTHQGVRGLTGKQITNQTMHKSKAHELYMVLKIVHKKVNPLRLLDY